MSTEGSQDEVSETEKAVVLMLDESDRGFILLAQELIATELKRVLKKAMVNDQHVNREAVKPLFDNGTAPLFSFWSQVRLAYAMGLINRADFEVIESLREVRNPCAHLHIPVSIVSPKNPVGEYRCTSKFLRQAQIEWTVTPLDGQNNDLVGKTSAEIDEVFLASETARFTVGTETKVTTGARAVFLVKLFAIINILRECRGRISSPMFRSSHDWKQTITLPGVPPGSDEATTP